MNAKIIAIVAVVVVAVAGVSAAVVLSNQDKGYYSDNNDCRLEIYGNADGNDYLDQKDVDKIQSLINDKKYSGMADANIDGVIDDKDLEMVKKIIELKKSNAGKADAEKEKMEVYYKTVDGYTQKAVFPVTKIICVNTQRTLDIAINIGVQDKFVAINDYVITNATLKDGKYMYRDFVDLPSVGTRDKPDAETILGMDADAIYAGTYKYYLKTSADLEKAETYCGKTVLRLASWEKGGYANGALMLGFFTDADESAQKFVRWMDEIDKKVDDVLNKIEDKSKTKLLLASSNTWFCAQQDGVSTAVSGTGVTNVGNMIITSVTGTGGSVSTYSEDIVTKNPGIIIISPYIYFNQTSEELATKYGGYTFPLISTCDAVKNKNIYMMSYQLPFVLQKMMAAKFMFSDEMADFDVDKYLKEYTDTYCNLGSTDYTFNKDQFYYKP